MCNKARTTVSLGLFGLRSFAFAPAAIIAIAVTNSPAVIRIGAGKIHTGSPPSETINASTAKGRVRHFRAINQREVHKQRKSFAKKLGNYDSGFSKLALASPYADDSWRRLRLCFPNRLQEEPLEVGRGAPFLS
jgi:hypothetical protein